MAETETVLKSLVPSSGKTEGKFQIRGDLLQDTTEVIFTAGSVTKSTKQFDKPPSDHRVENVEVPDELTAGKYNVSVKDSKGGSSKNSLLFEVTAGVDA